MDLQSDHAPYQSGTEPDGVEIRRGTVPKIARLRRYGAFEEVRADWLALQRKACPSPFQTLEWCEKWWRTVGVAKRRKLVLIAGYGDDGRLHFLLPLVLRRIGPFAMAQALGDKHAACHGPMYSPELLSGLGRREIERLAESLRALLPDGDLLVLDAQPDVVDGRPNPWLALNRRRSANSLSLTRLGEDWVAFDAAHRSARARGKERNRENGLRRLGEFAFRVAHSHGERMEMFDALRAQKSEWYRSVGLPDLFASKANCDFLRDIAALERSEAGVWPILSGLSVAGEWITLNLGVIHRDQYAGLLLSVAEGDTKRYSPGHLLITKTMQYCAETGISDFSFGSGESEIKARWADRRSQLFLCTWPLTKRGRVLELYLHGSADAKRLIKSSPVLWRCVERLRRLPTPALQTD